MEMNEVIIDENLKESIDLWTFMLPIISHRTTIRKNIHGYMPLHWHDELQFVVIIQGEARFQVNEEAIIVQEGDGLFINSGCLHMAEDGNESNCVYICLNVPAQSIISRELYTAYVAPYVQATNLPYVLIPSSEMWGQNIIEATLNIHQCLEEQPPYYEMDITPKLTVIWKSLITNGFPLEYDQSAMIKNQRMKAMLQWIHLHYGENIRLDDIAKAGQLSRSECCRYFKRTLKMTPLQYVTDYRIQKSVTLLQQPESNVTDVAYQVGFNSTSYFIDQFRKAMNMTPLRYKKSKLERLID
ncbi:AraC family transcriptional regulator [Halalkalibacterium halodurans]|uniref:AraC family transcriptional regulator n=1 Tax=Halalkalibacterium halodurans TaxID=86665 RepID=UPI002E21BCCF|nr:AraC family transcriptional regulator [Halalkalibacterium halodurans]